MEKTSFVGIKSPLENTVFTIDLLGYISENRHLCIYYLNFLSEFNEKALYTKYAIESLDFKEETQVLDINDIISSEEFELKSRALYEYLISKGEEYLSKIISNIPKSYRPDTNNITFEYLQYELSFIVLCLIYEGHFSLVGRYGEKLRKVIRSMEDNDDLMRSLGLNKIEKNILIYKPIKPVRKPITPLPYRALKIKTSEEAISYFESFNQVPLVGPTTMNQLLRLGLDTDQDRFSSYIQKHTGLNLNASNIDQVTREMDLTIIQPFYLNLIDKLNLDSFDFSDAIIDIESISNL